MHNATDTLNALKSRQNELEKIFSPTLLRLSDKNQKDEFLKILATPGLTINDNIFDQISEFLKINHPQRRYSTDELKRETELHLNGINSDEYGVWAFYPWSRRLVHLLDEEEFIAVRTSRNRYKITPGEYVVLREKKIGVVGLSVGQSVSVTLAMERICGEIRLADFDILELTNLNRIRTGVHNLGLPKVYSVAREISEIDPYLKVTCFDDGLTEANMENFFTRGGKLDLLIEESDGFDIKILSRFRARALKVPVLMEASDRCMVDVERFDLEPEREILHGIVKELDVEKLKSLKTNEEKIPYMLDVLGIETTSPRLKASMVEMHHTVATWPQLASAVTMGGGITADVARRILLNLYTDSGRFHVDIEELIGNKVPFTGHQIPQKAASNDKELLKIASQFKTGETIKQDDLEKIMQAAAAAPSFGNLQPWKWVVCGSNMILFGDGSNASLIDHYGYARLVSMGCALQNVISMSQSLGYKTRVEFGAQEIDKPLAVLHLEKSSAADPLSEYLASAIPDRRTSRGQGNASPFSNEAGDKLRGAVISESDASLSLITDEGAISEIAELNARCERIRLLNPELNLDYFQNELKLSRGSSKTGLALSDMNLSQGMETMHRLVADPRVARLLWDWDKGSVFEKEAYASVSRSSAVGLITMTDDSVSSLMKGGMAAERLWLTATKLNLGLQPICLPLLLLKHNPKIKEGRLPAEKFTGLGMLNEQLSVIFNQTKGRSAVFLFRIFDATPAKPILKKSASEIFLKC
jgi:molybdopterin/thiamine biosynthesis adenylyltransferase